jgi:DNA polymerase elongation subunit (family B)
MAQGIETVRRDNCLLVRNVVTTSLEKILVERDEEGAKEYVRAAIRDLLMNRMDLSLLVITKVGPSPPPHTHTTHTDRYGTHAQLHVTAHNT